MAVEVALDLAALHERLGGRRRDEERVGAGRSLERQPGSRHVAGELAAREPTPGVRHPVVGAVEALHARLPEAQHTARSHDACQLTYDGGRVGDRPVAQDRHAHDRVERARGERQTPGVGGDEPDRVVALAEQGECFAFEVDGDEVAPICEPPAGRAGAASHVEEPAAGCESSPASSCCSNARVERYHQCTSSTSAIRRYSASSMTLRDLLTRAGSSVLNDASDLLVSATMAVTTTGSGTSAGDRTARTRLASLFPIASGGAPVVRRATRHRAVPGPATPGRRFYAGSLLSMDGQWFRMIALDWYDRPYHPGAWSEYPFFPLFPAVAGALMQGGMPSTVALAGLAWLASLLAFAAIHRLAIVHAGPAAATMGGVVRRPLAGRPQPRTRILGCVLPRRLGVGAGVRRPRRAGSAAGAAVAVATASRPNGWIAAVAVIIVIARTDRSWRAVAPRGSYPRPCSCSGGSGTSTMRPAIRSCSGRPSRRGRRRRSSSGPADPGRSISRCSTSRGSPSPSCSTCAVSRTNLRSGSPSRC